MKKMSRILLGLAATGCTLIAFQNCSPGFKSVEPSPTSLDLPATVTPEATTSAPLLNIKNYGALADAETDAAPAIQSAIADAAAGKGTVYIPRGTYKVRQSITVPSNVHIQGDGINSSVLLRTENYGDTIIIGSSSVAMAVDVSIKDLYLLAYSGNWETAGYPNSSMTPVTAGTAHIRAYGLVDSNLTNLQISNLPIGVDVIGGAYSQFANLQFHGAWDMSNALYQITELSVRFSATATQGHPQVYSLSNNSFTGFCIAGRCFGPRINIQFLAAEDIQVSGGLMGGGYFNVAIEPSAGVPLLGLEFNQVFFDGAQAAEIYIDNHGSAQTASNISIGNTQFNGEGATNSALYIGGSGSMPSAMGLSFVNNNLLAYNGAGMVLGGLVGGSFSGNTIRGYNLGQSSASIPTASSAIFIGGLSRNISVVGNTLGGGIGYEAAGTPGNYCKYGVYVENPSVNTNITESGTVNAGY